MSFSFATDLVHKNAFYDSLSILRETQNPAAKVEVTLTAADNQEIPANVTSVKLKLTSAEQTFPPLPKTLEKLFVYRLPSLKSPFALPPGLNQLRRLSLDGIHFPPESATLAVPAAIPLSFLELTNCHSFRLMELKIEILSLRNCNNVFLNDTGLPKLALSVKNVTFNIFAASKIPSTLKVLRLEETSINKLHVPHGLVVFYAKNVNCESIHFGKKPDDPKLTKKQIHIEAMTVEWTKSSANASLYRHLETNYGAQPVST